MTWVLIDVSYLAHRTMHVLGHLETGDIPTGVLFGFFTSVRSICEDPRIFSQKIVAFFDSAKSHRKLAFPGYKQGRRKTDRTDEERDKQHAMWDQLKLLRTEILPAMGVQCLLQTGLESDDLMAAAAASMPTTGQRECVIVTADSDLWQCITDEVHWYDPQRRRGKDGISKARYLDRERFLKEKGIEPKEWVKVKAIAGDTSDNLPGIPRVGEVSALKFLQGTLPKHHKTYAAIEADSETFTRNIDLMRLPHPRTRPVELQAPEFNTDAFFAMAERYGLVMFLNEREQWERFFRRRWPKLRKRRSG